MKRDPGDITAPIEPVIASERQTAAWDVKNAFGNYSALIAAQIVVAVFSFASVRLITHHVGTDGYGGVVAVIAASQMAQIFVNWTGIALARFGVQEFVERGSITDSFWARTAVFVPNTIVFLLLGVFWLPLLGNGLKLPAETLWVVAAHLAASACWQHVQFAMLAVKRPRLQGAMVAAERVLIFASLLALLYVGRLGVTEAAAAYAIIPSVMTVLGLFAIRRMFSWRLKLSVPAVKKVFAFSLPLLPSSFIGYLSTNHLDAFFVTQYLTRSDLGVYSIAYQMIGILMQFPLLGGSLLLPLFVTLHTTGAMGRITKYLQDLVPLMTLIGSLAAVFAAMAMRILIPAAFGAEADGAIIIFWILVSAAVISIPTLIGLAPYTNAISLTYIASISATVSAIVNFAANYFLIPIYGLKGCAWATVLAYGASILVAIAILRFRYEITLRWTFAATVPALAASAYASATNDLTIAFIIAIAVAFVIVLVWRRGLRDGIEVLKDYAAFTERKKS